MALTKALTVVHANISLAAGAADTTSGDQDLTAVYRTVARIRFTNGATGPTVQAQTKVQVAEDTTAANYMTLATVYGGTTANAVTEHVVEIPDAIEHARFVSGSNTAQAVTLRVVIEKITGI